MAVRSPRPRHVQSSRLTTHDSRLKRRSSRRERGISIIGVLVFILVISILLSGAASLSVSHQERAVVDSSYAAALDAAEDGVNYELNKISQDPSKADGLPGYSYTTPTGTVKVYCTNRDGTSPWTSGNPLYVVSTGVVGRVSRTVKVASKGYLPDAKYAIYASTNVSLTGSPTVDGDVGTNGSISFTGNPTVTGSVYLNGPNATETGGSGIPKVVEPQPVVYPTTDQVAMAMFPQGGLPWLATHNDNTYAQPAIVGNTISLSGRGSVTLPGPGNYYLTSISLSGGSTIHVDNTNGPVNIWIGPDGGAASVNLSGNGGIASTITDGTNPVHIYLGSGDSFSMSGTPDVDALIYAVNNGAPYSSVSMSGNPTIVGQVIADTVSISGHPTVNYVPEGTQAGSYSYYGYDNAWTEVNPR